MTKSKLAVLTTSACLYSTCISIGGYHWRLPLEATIGGYHWQLPLEATIGGYHWRLPLEATIGTPPAAPTGLFTSYTYCRCVNSPPLCVYQGEGEGVWPQRVQVLVVVGEGTAEGRVVE